MDANTPLTRPAVIGWYKAYCAVLVLLYLFTAAASLVFFLGDPEELDMPLAFARGFGVLLLGMSLVLMAVALLPLLLAPRRWLWIYGVVLIGLGMTSACFVPFCIPLLLFWLKPNTKAYYGAD